MQEIISRLNRAAIVSAVSGFLAIVAIATAYLLQGLVRTAALAIACALSAIFVIWLLASRSTLARALQKKDLDFSKRAQEWANKVYWYEQLLDLVQMPMTVTDNDMNWTFINAAVEKLLGKSRKEIFGQHCSHWGAGICNTRNCGIQRLRSGFNQTIFTQWGLDFLVDTTYLKDLDGNTVGHVEIVTDISTKVQVRGQVREAIESIVTSSSQIEKATQSLADGASTQAANLEEIASTMESRSTSRRT